MSAAVSAAVAHQYRRQRILFAAGQVDAAARLGFYRERLSHAEARQTVRYPEVPQHVWQQFADAGDAWEARLAGIGHRGTTAAEVME
jgi:hypothetical protein